MICAIDPSRIITHRVRPRGGGILQLAARIPSHDNQSFVIGWIGAVTAIRFVVTSLPPRPRPRCKRSMVRMDVLDIRHPARVSIDFFNISRPIEWGEQGRTRGGSFPRFLSRAADCILICSWFDYLRFSVRGVSKWWRYNPCYLNVRDIF